MTDYDLANAAFEELLLHIAADNVPTAPDRAAVGAPTSADGMRSAAVEDVASGGGGSDSEGEAGKAPTPPLDHTTSGPIVSGREPAGDAGPPPSPAGARLRIIALGHPAAQGSKHGFVRGGKAVLVETGKHTKTWREDVKHAALVAIQRDGWVTATGPVRITFTAFYHRPKSHPKRTVTYPTGHNLGDIDKVARSCFDALVAAGALRDDSLVISLRCDQDWTGTDGRAFPNTLASEGAVIDVEVLA